MHFLSGALTWDVSVNRADSLEASKIVWLDSFLTNVDRTWRNTNMLLWHGKELWLIDHGSSLYFHHNWDGWENIATSPFPYIKDHALLKDATRLQDADKEMRRLITPEIIDDVVSKIPEEWLRQSSENIPPEEQRRVYSEFLKRRLSNSEIFLNHADRARQELV